MKFEYNDKVCRLKSRFTYVQYKRHNRLLVMDNYKYRFHDDYLPHKMLQKRMDFSYKEVDILSLKMRS